MEAEDKAVNVANHTVALVVNLNSRSGESTASRAVAELKRQGVQVGWSCLIDANRSLLDAVTRAIELGYRIIVVAGGDGTIRAAADLFANRTDLILGVLPAGTGNEVAKMLGIPRDLRAACRIIAAGRVGLVDLAQANGEHFVHTAILGHLGEMNHSTPRWMIARFGRLAYAWSFAVAFFRARPFRVKVTTGAEIWEGETTVVMVGNGRLHAPTRFILPGSIEDRMELNGRVVVYGPRDAARLTQARAVVGQWLLSCPQHSQMFSFIADEVTVAAEPPQFVDLDGEEGRPTPTVFRAGPKALRILVPGPQT